MLQLHARAALEVTQLLEHGGDDGFEVAAGVFVVVAARGVQGGEEGAVGAKVVDEGGVRR